MPQRLHRIPTRYALGAGVAVTTVTVIATNITDVRRMVSTLSFGSAVVLAVWLVINVRAREMDARMARQDERIARQDEVTERQTELEVQQARHLRTMTTRLFSGDTGDDTGPQPLRSVK